MDWSGIGLVRAATRGPVSTSSEASELWLAVVYKAEPREKVAVRNTALPKGGQLALSEVVVQDRFA